MKKCLPFLLLLPFCAYTQTVLTSYNTGVSFTCIAVDSNYNIWAGRSDGAYLLNKLANPAAAQFQSVAGTTAFNVQALAADAAKNIWAGHNGRGGSTAAGGGIERIPINNTAGLQHYAPDRNADCFTFLARNGVATLNSAGLAIDTAGTVWSAQKYHDLTSSPDYILTPGSLSFKPASSAVFFSKGTYQDYIVKNDPPELPYPAYTCNPTISQTAQSRNVYSVACGKNQVWISVAPYISRSLESFPARLLKYNLDGTWAKVALNLNDVGATVGGVFNGVYVAPNGDVWATMSAAKGFAVLRNGKWTYVNTSNACIFPAPGAAINNNAIWGNKLGQVFIGTNAGLIVYRGTGTLTSDSSYTLYTAASFGLISNQILGGASEKDSIQWIATDNGIMSTKLGGNSPVSAKSFDYTMCNNDDINLIENVIVDPIKMKQQDYHTYRVETQVCSTSGPNGRYCNAEYVYKMMKNDITLTSPTPYDFPYDNVPLLLLTGKKAEIGTVVDQSIKAWDPAAGSIKYVTQLFPGTLYKTYFKISPLNKLTPFITGDVDMLGRPLLIGRDILMARQKADNPTSFTDCALYNLYNSYNFIADRAAFKITIGLTCGDNLKSIVYDQVRIISDDSKLTLSNYTQKGHFLYPGKVLRTVVEECGVVKVVTVGTGLNECGDNWRGEMNAVGNIILGSILFKNIDLRLKKAFETAH